MTEEADLTQKCNDFFGGRQKKEFFADLVNLFGIVQKEIFLGYQFGKPSELSFQVPKPNLFLNIQSFLVQRLGDG